jgi:hypothetical protein
MIDKLVLEANVAFLLNMRLFEELDVMAQVPGAQVRSLEEALEQAAIAMKSTATTTNRGQGGSSTRQDQAKTKKNDTSKGTHTTTGMPAGPATCPFAHMGQNNKKSQPAIDPGTTATHNTNNTNHKNSSKRCPWPFVFMHDPMQGFKDWQTWWLVGLILAWVWSLWT